MLVLDSQLIKESKCDRIGGIIEAMDTPKGINFLSREFKCQEKLHN